MSCYKSADLAWTCNAKVLVRNEELCRLSGIIFHNAFGNIRGVHWDYLYS